MADKAGLTVGMGMTEKQGGSDVRANTTRRSPTPGGPLDGDDLPAHRPQVVLLGADERRLPRARPDRRRPGCFLLPRVLDDGTRNDIRLQRLKDKLGNRSNASSEIELDGAWAVRVGDEGRGIRTILDMVASTRLDCVLGSAATMRAALVRGGAPRPPPQRLRRAARRPAADAQRARRPRPRERGGHRARACGSPTPSTPARTTSSRLGVALGKFWVCKRTAPMVAEALECLGGNGYVEENGLARLYREAPLNSIWEGSGNVNALDVLRALTREPASLAALGKELALARGHDRVLDAAIDECESAGALALGPDAPWGARRLVERLALTLQAALLVRHSPGAGRRRVRRQPARR